jgi:hypothetical protein
MIWNLIGTIGGEVLNIVGDVVGANVKLINLSFKSNGYLCDKINFF